MHPAHSSGTEPGTVPNSEAPAPLRLQEEKETSRKAQLPGCTEGSAGLRNHPESSRSHPEAASKPEAEAEAGRFPAVIVVTCEGQGGEMARCPQV